MPEIGVRFSTYALNDTMTYEKNHTINDCDKCLKTVGKENLNKVPFLYLDKNDDTHEDMSPTLRIMNKCVCDNGYRQYYVCDDCKTK